MPTTGVICFVPDDGPTVLSVTSFGADSYACYLSTSSDIDLSEYYSGTTGIEVFDGEEWQPSISCVWDTMFPAEIDFNFETIANPAGMPWRIRPPVDEWTVDGVELFPDAGFVLAGEMMMTPGRLARLQALRAAPANIAEG